MDAVTTVPAPRNEPVLDYAPGSPERASQQARLAELGSQTLDLTMTLGGRQRMAGGDRVDVVQPHRHSSVLGVAANATHDDAKE
jgi:1-pyrroline-5-carboxylate dehydrogenase